MNRLVPERRIDRNGRVVTRHVRAIPKAGGGAPLPAPSVPVPQPAAPERPYKPNAKQLATNTYPMSASIFTPDSRLLTGWPETSEGKQNVTYVFDANMVEIYDVVGACTRAADAIKLLSLGIRHPGEARDYLHLHGCDDLIADRSALARAALERGLEPYDGLVYLDSYDEPGVDPRNAVDAARFSTTSLYSMEFAGRIALDIAEGKTSFDDVKGIGLGRLKATKNLKSMGALLREMHAAPDEYSVAGVRAVLDRAESEKLTKWDHGALVRVLLRAGEKRTLAAASLDRLVTLVRTYETYTFDGAGAPSHEEAVDLALYHSEAGHSPTAGAFENTREAFIAGVPVEIAREVFSSGGDGKAAIAVHQGIAPGLAGGWI